MKETVIGLGLAAIGRPQYINVRQDLDLDKSADSYQKNAFNILDFAYHQGIRHFDTAPSYGKGEEFLQQWYKQKRHKDVTFSTKWGYTYVADWDLKFKGAHEIKQHSLEKLMEQWSVSKHLLPALKTYQIHSATFESGILDNNEVLEKLFEIKKETGVKIGISTSGANQGEVLEYASQVKINNEPLFESFQVTYNVLETNTHKVLKRLMESGSIVIVKEALANGRVFKNDDYKHYEGLYTELQGLSEKYKVSVDAIALRFVMDHLEPSVILSGASNRAQLIENLKAKNFKLENRELLSLKQFAMNPNVYWNEREKLAWN